MRGSGATRCALPTTAPTPTAAHSESVHMLRCSNFRSCLLLLRARRPCAPRSSPSAAENGMRCPRCAGF